MGAAVSVTDVVNTTIQKTQVNQHCQCHANSLNQIGDINVNLKNCLNPGFNIQQNAKAKCNCPVHAAISQLAAMVSKSDEAVQSAFSGSVSTNSQSVKNTSDVENDINQACGSFAAANNVIGDVNYNADCTGMTQAELESEKQNAINIKQAASSQAACLLTLAQKVATKLANSTKGDTKTQTPWGSLASAILGDGGIMGPIGSLGKSMGLSENQMMMIGVGVIFLIIMMVVVAVSGKKGKHHRPPPPPPPIDDGYGDDYRSEKPLYTRDNHTHDWKKLSELIVNQLIEKA